ncbi:MAG TPA: BrnA antitoxin family protein [Candidatus Margulisiibacteriota bacterium]|nr:BrnA antitoxin family protein [Candidatus Margulisiibacteriota bacterium]
MRKRYEFSKGRRGAVVAQKGKTRITIHLDDAIIERFRLLSQQTGKGYQTLINDALRDLLDRDETRLTADAVRQIIREELAHD